MNSLTLWFESFSDVGCKKNKLRDFFKKKFCSEDGVVECVHDRVRTNTTGHVLSVRRQRHRVHFLSIATGHNRLSRTRSIDCQLSSVARLNVDVMFVVRIRILRRVNNIITDKKKKKYVRQHDVYVRKHKKNPKIISSIMFLRSGSTF